MTTQSSILDVISEKASEGYHCSCCGSYIKEYHRSFNAGMAMMLIHLYRHNERDFVHIENFLTKHSYPRCGDFSYLTLYGLLEKKVGERADGSKKNGYYKLTGKALMFIEQKITVHSKFKMLNGKFMGFEGEQIDIKTALGKRFDFNKLMNNEY